MLTSSSLPLLQQASNLGPSGMPCKEGKAWNESFEGAGVGDKAAPKWNSGCTGLLLI